MMLNSGDLYQYIVKWIITGPLTFPPKKNESAQLQRLLSCKPRPARKRVCFCWLVMEYSRCEPNHFSGMRFYNVVYNHFAAHEKKWSVFWNHKKPCKNLYSLWLVLNTPTFLGSLCSSFSAVMKTTKGHRTIYGSFQKIAETSHK